MRQQPTNETAGLRQVDEEQPPYLYPDYVATRLRAPKKPLIILPKPLSDTTGPAYGRGPIGGLDNDLTRQHEGEPLGERIIVTGRVLDGDGRPVRNSLIEIWQANPAGRYDDPIDDREDLPLDPETYSGFGRSDTVEGGKFSFVTVKPGPVPGSGESLQASHIIGRSRRTSLRKGADSGGGGEADASDPPSAARPDRRHR